MTRTAAAAIIASPLAAVGRHGRTRIADRRPQVEPPMCHPVEAVVDGDSRLHDHPLLGPLPPAASVWLTFDGRPIEARAGEPIVAALLAAGVRVFRTMPGSGEPRGGWCMVGRCGDCAVVVDGRPDVPACVIPVADGMTVRTQHGLGEGAWDPNVALRKAGGDFGSGQER